MSASSLRLTTTQLRQFRATSTINTPLFTAKLQPNTVGHLRATIVTPKKKFPLATTRNYLKRQYLHAIRAILTPTTHHSDIIFYPHFTPQTSTQIKQTLSSSSFKNHDH